MRSRILILLILLLVFPLGAYSFPQYMDVFNKDKFARSEKKNQCSICHINPNGGGSVNEFGRAFDVNGFKITNNLRQKFPELFDLMKALEPKIIRIKPPMVIVGQEVKIMIVGNNFANDSTVKVDGSSENIQIAFVNPKDIDVTITFTDIGKHTIQVVNVTGQASNTFKVKVKPSKV